MRNITARRLSAPNHLRRAMGRAIDCSNKFLTASLAFSTSSSVKAAANDRQRPADATSMVSLPLHLDLSLPASFQPLLKLSIYCSLVVIFSFAPVGFGSPVPSFVFLSGAFQFRFRVQSRRRVAFP